mgnify:CR=1 FL=1
MTILGFPHDTIPSAASCILRAHLPVDCNRISLRGSGQLAVTKIRIGKDAIVYDGGPSRSSIRGDVLTRGIRVYEDKGFFFEGMMVEVTVINLSNEARPAEIYLILRTR